MHHVVSTGLGIIFGWWRVRYRGARCNKEPRNHIRKAAGVAPRRVYWRAFPKIAQSMAERIATLGITFGRAAGAAPHHVYWRAFPKIAQSALQHEG